MTGRWSIDEDEEFGGELLRWNDHVIAQTTGEEQDGCMEAYRALVDMVRADPVAAVRAALEAVVIQAPDKTYTGADVHLFNLRAIEDTLNWWSSTKRRPGLPLPAAPEEQQ